MNRNGLITVFVQRVIAATDYTELDETYLINQVLGWLGEADYQTPTTLTPWEDTDTLTLLDALIRVADTNGTLARREMNADMVGAQLMALFVPRPSEVNRIFGKNMLVHPLLLRTTCLTYHAAVTTLRHVKLVKISRFRSRQNMGRYKSR